MLSCVWHFHQKNKIFYFSGRCLEFENGFRSYILIILSKTLQKKCVWEQHLTAGLWIWELLACTLLVCHCTCRVHGLNTGIWPVIQWTFEALIFHLTGGLDVFISRLREDTNSFFCAFPFWVLTNMKDYMPILYTWVDIVGCRNTMCVSTCTCQVDFVLLEKCLLSGDFSALKRTALLFNLDGR